MTRRRGSSLARRIAFTLLATVLGLGTIEIGAWLWEGAHPAAERRIPTPAPPERPYTDFATEHREAREALRSGGAIPMERDPLRGWRLTRDPVTQGFGGHPYYNPDAVNSLGLRGGELAERAPGEVRMLSLGDSSIFGHGVPGDAVFLEVAAQVLSRRWGGADVTAVNGGVPGYDSGQSLATLREVGEEVQPAWVVIGNLWSDVYATDRDLAREADREVLPAGPLTRLATYRVMHRLLRPALRPVKVRWIATREDVGDDPAGAACRVPLGEYTDNLEQMAAQAEALGARPAFLALPAPMDFDEIPPPETVLRYRESMRMVAGDHGAPYVDGPAYFLEAGATIGYFGDAVHPDVAGHALLGLALADALEPFDPPDEQGTSHPRTQ